MMTGIINVLKPPGMTSFDVVGYLRRKLGIKKIGHAGTLDPQAAGVLPVCIGKASKVLEFMTGLDKVYRTEMCLGIETDTQDAYGKVIRTSHVSVSREEAERAILSFAGEIVQVPPMYSAVKMGGRKLYELARQGITVERAPRRVLIKKIEIIDFIDDNKILFDVYCSKGTYIRTLCADIGEKLGCGAHMSFLVRKAVGPFLLENSHTMEEIDEAVNEGVPEKIMLSADFALQEMKKVTLDSRNEGKFLNGIAVPMKRTVDNNDCIYGEEVTRVYNKDGEFVGLGIVMNIDGVVVLKPRKVLI